MTDREEALAQLQLVCEPNDLPTLTPEELEKILDIHLRAVSWSANTIFRVGSRKVYPITRNGLKYRVVISGTTGAAEPTWSTVTEGQTVSGTVTFEEDGFEFSNTYDINAVIKAGCRLKASKAARFPSTTGGMNMSKIYENWLRMAEEYEVPLVG